MGKEVLEGGWCGLWGDAASRSAWGSAGGRPDRGGDGLTEEGTVQPRRGRSDRMWPSAVAGCDPGLCRALRGKRIRRGSVNLHRSPGPR